jgi:alkylhydroperoxidase/carboxymuconolactone decarboxylase family protein YurZ
MAENPMEVYKRNDEEIMQIITDTRKLAFQEGALSRKHKYLIALAIDATSGAEEGIKALAVQAQKNGASREEILETLRVAYFVSGVGSIYAASRALKDIL